MLHNDPFTWTPTAETAYKEIKDFLISPQVLIAYDPKLPLLLATDASKVGLGAVLSHRLNNGEDRPIAYASRTLSSTEQKYPQIDKEALAIVWTIRKFFHYLYARHFILITDHKPLTQILHPEKSLPVLCISRMANYADYLSHFNYNIEFRITKENVNADYCSRAPVSIQRKLTNKEEGEEAEQFDDFDYFILNQVRQLPIRAEQISRETRKDPHLGKIVQALQSGHNLTSAGYKAPEANYTLAANCLLFEHRVVVPSSLRQPILEDLHAAHLGIVKMKGMARSFVYWPGIDADIERVAKACTQCAEHARAPPQMRNHHWEYPRGPWERIHVDYAGPVAGVMLLIIVDAYSKWMEVKPTNSTTSTATIAILDELFTAYGAPITIVSDNGTPFTSAEFQKFLQMSGVKYHKRIAPYHPSTNGQAERYVQTTKDKLKRMATTPSTIRQDLNEFLRQYRKAPHSTTGQSPAQLFLGRNLRTRLDLVRPQDTHERILEKQQVEFKPPSRNLHYEIDYQGKRFKRHLDQIRAFQGPDLQADLDPPPTPEKVPEQPRRIRFYETEPGPRNEPPAPREVPPPHHPPEVPTPPATPPGHHPPGQARVEIPRRSTRQRRQPQRYTPPVNPGGGITTNGVREFRDIPAQTITEPP
ncbi:PREDICTED: uncharacterized protein K02A2.6-like [Trachymyrmex cornetzi]|uniref:uncharacterized protein K02A2.6-like n=1 Tax=Trachymyrmex cornetzi TaxID=471704 RepID=UPI00084F85F4|nr:PREDICTED: uncharacterized protein K02A2.6-like [Trachymyrmex cornetzi]